MISQRVLQHLPILTTLLVTFVPSPFTYLPHFLQHPLRWLRIYKQTLRPAWRPVTAIWVISPIDAPPHNAKSCLISVHKGVRRSMASLTIRLTCAFRGEAPILFSSCANVRSLPRAPLFPFHPLHLNHFKQLQITRCPGSRKSRTLKCDMIVSN